jgi:hypothetical protein
LDFFRAIRKKVKEKLHKCVSFGIAERRFEMFRRDKVERFRLFYPVTCFINRLCAASQLKSCCGILLGKVFFRLFVITAFRFAIAASEIKSEIFASLIYIANEYAFVLHADKCGAYSFLYMFQVES